MISKPFKERTFGKVDAILTAGFAALAAILFFCLKADYAFPGESAQILATLAGCADHPVTAHPLLRFFARLLGGGNALAPLAGAILVASVYALVAFFIHENVHSSSRAPFARSASRLAGCVAATLTLFAPAVLTGATHLEANLFCVAWLFVALLPFLIWAKATFSGADAAFALLVGGLWGAGLAETPVAWWFAPFAAWGVWVSCVKRGINPFGCVALFFLAVVSVYMPLAAFAADGLAGTTLAMGRAALAYLFGHGWLVLALFATAPFAFTFFTARRALDDSSGWMMWTYHFGISFCLVLSVALLPLSPAGLVEASFGKTLPVATSVFAAIAAGYVAAYWWMLARTSKPSFILSITALSATLPVWALAALVNFVDFDSRCGAFADALADRYLDELGNRPYLVPYGILSDNLQLAARHRGLSVQFLFLHRDNDRAYAAKLAEGLSDPDLRMSLDLGVYAFSKELMQKTPDLIASLGRPGLWTAADAKPVPGFALFNGEKSEEIDFAAQWKGVADVLVAHEGWGSREIAHEKNAIESIRLEARRHFGLMANERAAWLQDQGRDDEAYALYSLALDEIDSDNLSALFNLLEMARAGHAKAKTRQSELEKKVKQIVDDKTRRYRLRPVLEYYGRLRSYQTPPSADEDFSAAKEVTQAMTLLRERNLVGARKILDGATKDHPKDMHAWSLLAAVVMQQSDEAKDAKQKQAFDEDLRKNIVPMMEKASDGAEFYVQSVRAFLLLREGESKRTAARDAFAAAAKAKPDAPLAQNALLGMDISLNDPVSAQMHAHEVLRRDRNVPLANYVMGSLALQKGDLEKAVRYLHKATDVTNGTVLAANDLAEALRRLKQYDEAERYARLAVAAAPKLYVVWDTLGCILLDRGANLDEAERCIEKACELSSVDGKPEDIRMLTSLARVLIRKGDKPRARMTLAKMRARLDELAAFEREEYDKLLKEVQ